MIKFIKTLFKIMWEFWTLGGVVFLFTFLVLSLIKLALFAPVKPTDIFYILLLSVGITFVLFIIFCFILMTIDDDNEDDKYED